MARPESSELAAADDTAAAINVIRECVAVIAERGRGKLTKADLYELAEILAATDRIQGYTATIRQAVSATYQRPIEREK